MSNNYLRHPFGEECCEAEIEILHHNYKDFYFEETPFNEAALDTDCYLIIGRRGSGKTSLAHYFSFQNLIPNSLCIDIDEPDVFANVLNQISDANLGEQDISIKNIVNIWTYVLWSLIFSKYQDDNEIIKKASGFNEKRGSHLIKNILEQLVKKYLPNSSERLAKELDKLLISSIMEDAKKEVFKITENRPLILAMDSLEKYSTTNTSVMMSLAALIECSSNFNIKYSNKGIYIKTFISTEIYPILAESVVTNPIKYIRNPIFMHWRPKDLMRLACWRFHSHLIRKNQLLSKNTHNIDWSSYTDVLKIMWIPYFGEYIENGAGIKEKTFPYILRHTQMRPRQIVVLCNAISKKSKKHFPLFKNEPINIIEAVKESVVDLANGVINSYSSVYKNIDKILDALNGIPTIFNGNHLDKIARKTASQWEGNYSPTIFKQIVSELGIVGIIRSKDEKSKIIEADFEYTLKTRLAIMSDDECVIHPMFFEKFRVNRVGKYIIYPFPDNADYKLM